MRYLKNKLIVGVIGIVFIFLLGFFSKDLYNKSNPAPGIPSPGKPKNILLPDPKDGAYKITRVLDGDTVVLETGEKFRYLGIDAPELNDRWGPEAKKFNEDMVLGKKIKIELDRTKLDKYGRILGYVWSGDIMVNEALVERGYAKVNLMKGEVKPKYLDRLQKAEAWAKQNNDGVWFDEWEQSKNL